METKNSMDVLPDYLENKEKLDHVMSSRLSLFLDTVSDYLLNFKYEELYTISDKSMDKEMFLKHVIEQLGNVLETLYENFDSTSMGITFHYIEPLNPLIGRIELFIYTKHCGTTSVSNTISSYIRTYSTKLCFVYKDNNFKLLPMFHSFEST